MSDSKMLDMKVKESDAHIILTNFRKGLGVPESLLFNNNINDLDTENALAFFDKITKMYADVNKKYEYAFNRIRYRLSFIKSAHRRKGRRRK